MQYNPDFFVKDVCVQNFLKQILSLLPRSAGIFLVGGIVRDRLLGMASHDFDFMVDHTEETDLLPVLKELCSQRILLGFEKVGLSFPVFKLRIFGFYEPVDLALARTERSTGSHHRDFEVNATRISAHEDGKRRDFTVNALFVRFFSENEVLYCELKDWFGGLEDLKTRCLRTVGDSLERMSEDPLRILRAIRFKNQKGFFLDEQLEKTVINHAHSLVPSLSMDRIQEEFLKSFLANPSKTHRDFLEFNLYRICFPGIFSLFCEETFKTRVAEFCDFLSSLPQGHKKEEVWAFLSLYSFLQSENTREFEELWQSFRVPQPRIAKTILFGLKNLAQIQEKKFPRAIQEKILCGFYGKEIQDLYQVLKAYFGWPELFNLDYSLLKKDGREIQSWGIVAGRGFEEVVLRVRELQFQGMDEDEIRKIIKKGE